MNQKEVNKLKMIKQVLDVTSANQTAYAGVQVFSDGVTDLRLKYDELKTLTTEYAMQLVGIAALKNEQKEATAFKAKGVAGILRAFAHLTHDPVLGGKLKFRDSSFYYGSSVAIGQKIELVLQLAIDHLPVMTGYGLTQQDIDELTALNNDLVNMQGSPRTAIIGRKELRSEIDVLFEEIDGLLHNTLDQLITSMKKTQPAFHNQYKDARKVVDLKGKSNKPSPPFSPEGPLHPDNPAGAK